eukprot:TRINITY_DN23795_c0_g1_i1.p1 TRINITY_DN23795_c0_g1~~TRINITY_DN23795_c0_g1_i1.p1  ORF type:complete len:268 (+),score=4.27 TRINITY_DN23795_c0_g1_i1:413-1216(+)
MVIRNFITLIILVFTLSCCNSPYNKNNNKLRQFTDMEGNTMFLPDSIRTICSNGNSINQLFLTLGVSNRIIATSASVKNNPWFGRIYPNIKELPVPFFNETDVNIEELVQYSPDLVILWQESNISRKIRKVGIPVFILNFSTPEEFKKAILNLGKILGNESFIKANKLCDFYDNILALVDNRIKNINIDKPVIYYCANNTLNTEGKESMVTSWIEEVGGQNAAVLAGVDMIRANISAETLIELDPDIIIVPMYSCLLYTSPSPRDQA